LLENTTGRLDGRETLGTRADQLGASMQTSRNLIGTTLLLVAVAAAVYLAFPATPRPSGSEPNSEPISNADGRDPTRLAKAREPQTPAIAPAQPAVEAGEGRQWHHVVEQSQVGKFGSQAIHNADNVVSIPTDIHRKISGFYSSKQPFTGDQTVRQWLGGQSFEQQRAFGQQVLRNLGVGQ